MILKVDKNTKLADELLNFVTNCSWVDAKDHIAQMIRDWTFADWETMFVYLDAGRIVGMASVMKYDYYPLPEIYPWISCIFVTEDHRGKRISGELISYANEYLKGVGFKRSYIPTEFAGLYENFGYTYFKDIINYGGGTDRLYYKDL